MSKKVEDGVRAIGVRFDPQAIERAILPYYTPWTQEQVRPRDGSWGYAIVTSGDLSSKIHIHAGDTFIFLGGAFVAVEKTSGWGKRPINAAEVVEEDLQQNAANGAIVNQLEERLKKLDGWQIGSLGNPAMFDVVGAIRLLLQLEIRMHRAGNPHDLDTVLGNLAEADTQAHDIASMVAQRAKVKELLDDLDKRIATRVEEYVEGWER